MKYHETSFEDYYHSVLRYNLHPELNDVFTKFPKKASQLENLVIYGPSGSGKYSQIIKLLKQYSPTELKCDKKMTANTEKQQYIYRISDIHFEIDMSLLGCNSKLLWHEIFFQIVDIISVKPDKFGIILCKNFHLIHAELLEIFYSYMQQYNHSHSNIKIKFFIMSEHISFIPTKILNVCQILRIKRPTTEQYKELSRINSIEPINNVNTPSSPKPLPFQPIYNKDTRYLFDEIESGGIINIKEIKSFPMIDFAEDMPKDVFNIICDNIIKEMCSPDKLSFTGFRDSLYDILTYNLDMIECLWYIIIHFIESGILKSTDDISDILCKTYTFLKYYNNNYRPIYHLESIMFYIINKIHHFE
uniref:Uncharacterized protein n=1 Tax=viral metagenome TaxID=1070528 RepID=A0A6C0D355_9ZZZZ